MLKVKALLLDTGGTLYDCEAFDDQFPLQIEKVLAERLGIAQGEAAARLSGRMEELSRTKGDPSKVRAMATFGVSREDVHAAFCQVEPLDFLRPEAEIAAVLRDIAEAGYELAILSNFRRILVDKILEALGIDPGIFRFFLTEDDGLPIKPAVEPFLECARRFGLQPSEIAYVGDDLKKDMVPAHSVGMQTVWVSQSDDAGALRGSVGSRIGSVLELKRLVRVSP